MGFKKRLLYSICIISLILVGSVLERYNYDKNSHINSHSNQVSKDITKLKTNGEVLINRVYNFTVNKPYHNYTDLFFQEHYNYYIFVQIVSPHECTIRINLKDPEDDNYALFYRHMKQSDGILEIPFGASLTGNHSVSIYIDTSYNLNIYVRIEKGSKCLHDILSPEQIGNLIQYNVSKFQNSSIQIDHAFLETNVLYKFFFGRVSAISIDHDNNLTYRYSLLDDQDISFSINWKNDQLEGIGGVSAYEFGTASEGIYTTNLSINCEVKYVNIVYAIVYDHKIANIVDETNSTTGNNSTNNNDFFNELASLPEEWLIGTTIFIGCAMAILTVMLVNNRRRNAVGLNLKEK